MPRPDAMCPDCGALERHRLLWMYFSTRTDLFDGRPKKLLHVAPEPSFEERLRRLIGAGYLSADIEASGAMVRMDICDIQYPDESFDVIYCSHVLEHVHDDRRAMRELRRVLKPDGWAVLQVPIIADKTFEDPSVTDPAERTRLFGQPDHVRGYGPDYVDRLQEAGFHVAITSAHELIDAKDIARLGLSRIRERVFHCTRQAPTPSSGP